MFSGQRNRLVNLCKPQDIEIIRCFFHGDQDYEIDKLVQGNKNTFLSYYEPLLTAQDEGIILKKRGYRELMDLLVKSFPGRERIMWKGCSRYHFKNRQTVGQTRFAIGTKCKMSPTHRSNERPTIPLVRVGVEGHRDHIQVLRVLRNYYSLLETSNSSSLVFFRSEHKIVLRPYFEHFSLTPLSSWTSDSRQDSFRTGLTILQGVVFDE